MTSSAHKHVLTEGGLVRTIKLGCPEQTMRFRWTGVPPLPQPAEAPAPAVNAGAAGELLMEMELLRIEGDKVTVRLWAPEQVRIVSAKKDRNLRPEAVPAASL